MSKIEIAIVILAVLMPLLALFFVVPKRKKKDKQPKVVKLPESEMPKMEQEKPFVPEKQEKPSRVIDTPNFNPDEFKEYFAKRKSKYSAPHMIYDDVPDMTESLFDFNKRNNKKEKKTIQEQLQDLSPELKAMIIAGVLDKKDFD
ncbi:MAG: hypothetical protein IKM43_00645 [Clostridia bacterium]|nr:hypothetical protein [Clostridia bacterium]